MIECPDCKAPNLESRHFCGKCGVKMVFSCPQCHFINHSGEHYCGGCGASFSLPPSPKSFLKEFSPASVPASAPASETGNKSNGASSSRAIKEFLNLRKNGISKKKQAKDDKKQVSQEEIERMIHEGVDEGKGE